jgi:hypothetical protein
MTKLPGQLNLDDYANRHKLRLELVSEEHAEERGARLDQQSADAKLKRMKDVALVGVALVFILALGTSCLAISVSRETTPEDKKWAWSTLTLITGAVLGFLFGKTSGNR